jgi:hypothetical protein
MRWEIHEIHGTRTLREVMRKDTLFCTINRKRPRGCFKAMNSRDFGCAEDQNKHNGTILMMIWDWLNMKKLLNVLIIKKNNLEYL